MRAGRYIAGTVDPLVQLVTGSTLPDENLVVGNNIEFHPSVGNLPAYLIDLPGLTALPSGEQLRAHAEQQYPLLPCCRHALQHAASIFVANNTFYRITPMSAFTLTVSANISLSFVNNSVTNDTGGMVTRTGHPVH